MSDSGSQLEQIRRQALVLSEAYRLRLTGILWWANLLLVATPAAAATAAAYFAGESSAIKNHYVWTGILAGGAAVLADPFSVDSINNAIESVLADCELAQSLSRKGLKRVEDFSGRRKAEQTIAIYNEVSGH